MFNLRLGRGEERFIKKTLCSAPRLGIEWLQAVLACVRLGEKGGMMLLKGAAGHPSHSCEGERESILLCDNNINFCEKDATFHAQVFSFQNNTHEEEAISVFFITVTLPNRTCTYF